MHPSHLRTIVLLGLIAVAGCGGTNPRPDPTIRTIAITGTAQVQVGQTTQLAATATLTDNSTQAVTTSSSWSSSNTGIATVNGSGVVTGVAAGTTEIRAARDGVTGTLNVLVSTAPVVPVLSFITITGTTPLRVGESAQWTATAVYSDGSMQNVTSTAQWSSSAGAVANVSGTGLVTAVSIGSADIRAQFQGLSLVRQVQVTKAVVAAFTVTPNADTIAQGVLPGQCGVFPNGGFNILRCTFDASSSIPAAGITAYRWEIPFDAGLPGRKFEGPANVTVANAVIECGYGLSGTGGGTGGGAAVIRKVKLTVVGPGGVEDTITPDVTFIRAGGC